MTKAFVKITVIVTNFLIKKAFFIYYFITMLHQIFSILDQVRLG